MRFPTIVMASIAFFLVGCVDDPVAVPEAISSAAALAASFGLTLSTELPPRTAAADTWYFVEGSASPNGSVVSVTVPVPSDALLDTLIFETMWAPVELVPLVHASDRSSLTAWGLLHFPPPGQVLEGESAGNVFGGIMQSTTYEVDFGDPMGSDPIGPSLEPTVVLLSVAEPSNITLVFVGKGAPAPLAALFRFTGQNITEPGSTADVLARTNGVATLTPERARGTGFVHAVWDSVGTRTADVHATRTDGPMSWGLTLNSELRTPRGWGFMAFQASAGPAKMDWEVTANLRGVQIDDGGAHQSILAAIPSVGASWQAPDIAVHSEGQGDSVAFFGVSIQPPVREPNLRYQHLDIGVSAEELLGYLPNIPTDG